MTADTMERRVRTRGFACMRVWLFAIGAFACVATPALAEQAHGIDCAKAATTVEKAICADPDLVADDQKLSSAYDAALHAVSPEGRASLRDGQRQWLAMVRRACDISGPPKSGDWESAHDCVRSDYNDRLERLGTAVQKFGGVTIRRADIYTVRKEASNDEEGGCCQGTHAGFDTLDIDYPQIDAPKSPSEIAFNKAMAVRSQKTADHYKSDSEGGEDLSLRYDDIRISPYLISVDFTEADFVHGGAHPSWDSATVHWLVGKGRELVGTDVFRADTDWKAFLRNYCFRKLASRKGGNPGFLNTPDDLQDRPADPEIWIFGRDGLTVQFGVEEVASYMEGATKVTIPWSALKPYLKDGAPPPWAK